ncbi:uncharacterized protein K452DRAFT_28970 [Aplosporella prunicola CBS 121167]|uniref:Uncharacterized protein n=1 Tax=Aplosporella prunicola CBS 121167 TaxID=1176127 RepID=A0A6A6BG78_9PEZI|nr:uncharacterized protein K452DRAFT_28970 [Aplosporella prunicola CBS 121167]KAF2142254.1 hypothetical protein K452DRAFT_28970 [Aplosporella prunicola CBS 121167]
MTPELFSNFRPSRRHSSVCLARLSVAVSTPCCCIAHSTTSSRRSCLVHDGLVDSRPVRPKETRGGSSPFLGPCKSHSSYPARYDTTMAKTFPATRNDDQPLCLYRARINDIGDRDKFPF